MEFSKKEIIIGAWNILRPGLGLMVLVIAFIFSLNLALGIVQDRLLQNVTPQSILFTIAAYLFQMGLNLGMLQICLNLTYNKDVDFSQLFSSFHLLIPYLLAALISLVILLLAATPGIMLLLFSASSDLDVLRATETWSGASTTIPVFIIIIPLVYISLRLQFYDYFLVDEECGVVEAVQKSMAITKGYIMELFLLGAVMSIIVLISLIPLGVGLFISVPLATMVNTCVYQKLKRTR